MALPASSTFSMLAAVQLKLNSDKNSASSTAVPSTNSDQPVIIAHAPTPSPPNVPDRGCAADVHCMTNHTAGDPSQPTYYCAQCGNCIHSELTCRDNVAALLVY